MRAAVGGDVGLVRLGGEGCGPSVKTLNRPCPWGGGGSFSWGILVVDGRLGGLFTLSLP